MSRKASLEAHVQKTVIEGTVLDAQDKSVDAYVTYTLNGQGRTEIRRNVLPQYALFHVQYRLNKQPKKK